MLAIFCLEISSCSLQLNPGSDAGNMIAVTINLSSKERQVSLTNIPLTCQFVGYIIDKTFNHFLIC